jgi:hypothetical protein
MTAWTEQQTERMYELATYFASLYVIFVGMYQRFHIDTLTFASVFHHYIRKEGKREQARRRMTKCL